MALLLKVGASGHRVQSLQRRLKLWGLTWISDDGIFGNNTKKAVMEFQQSNKLSADGIVGPATSKALIAATVQVFNGFTVQDLQNILGISAQRATDWAGPLSKAMLAGGITTKHRAACFIANVGHECANFATLTENLNYSAEGLAKTWPKRYASGGKPNALALRLARNPEAIANNVYANRMGNGSEASGDGYRYRGHYPIMLTGKDAYARCGAALGIDLLTDPDAALTPDLCSRISVWFWASNDVNDYADADDFDGVCDKINIGRKTEKEGDAIGYSDRHAVYRKAKNCLGI